MVKYAENELLSITDFTKKISSVMKDIKDHTIEKVGVLKNNKLEAVVISTEEYSRLKDMEALLEEIEHREIYESIKVRRDAPDSDFISIEDMAKKFDIDMNSL